MAYDSLFEPMRSTLRKEVGLRRIASSVLGAALFLVTSLLSAGTVDTVAADSGDIRITPILHGSVQVEYGDTVIYVDPWSRGDYSAAPKADLILVTDIHGDHLDVEMIAKLRQHSTVLVVPAAAADQVEGEIVMGNGETQELAGILIETVPMYNLERGPEEGGLFHEKGRGNGYVLTVGGQRLYLAGDTACIPEMRELTDIAVAFVPMNLPYTMTPSEAAECVKAFQPRVVYPYHYRGSDLGEFSSVLEDESEIEVRIREWYPGS
jgi:L-ascorbate metabolism protein UlaG (beta-lactamase superfamily)